jgi:hypothetical protein
MSRSTNTGKRKNFINKKSTNTKKMKNFMNRNSPTPGRRRRSN